MPFKKLNEDLLTRIAEVGLEEPLPLQKSIISNIKSGADIFAVGPEGSGKTTALIITILNKLKMRAGGDNPVALIFVKDKAAIEALAEQFEPFIEYSGIRLCKVNEDRIINHQKDEIYLGADIVIATPKRLSKLYFLNGINLMELKMLVVSDAEFLVGRDFHTDIQRIAQSIKCQRIVTAQKYDDKLARLRDLFMEAGVVVKS